MRQVGMLGRWSGVAGCLALAMSLSGAVGLRADTIPLRHPRGSSTKLNEAVALIGKGQLKQADALLAGVESRDPGYLSAVLGRAQIAVSEKQLDEANRMVDSVLVRQDRLPEAHNMKGLVLLLRKDEGGAQREFARAIELQPRYVTPRVYLAVMARTSGDYAGAAAQYKGLVAVAPRFPAGYLGEAEALIMLHRDPEAMAVLESWKGADPKSALPYVVIGKIDVANGKPQEAMPQLRAALAKSPHDADALVTLGEAYEAAGNAGAAGAQYQAALAANARDGEAALRLGTLEAGVGQNDRAMGHFRQALAAEPDNAVVENNVAWLLASEGKSLDEALRLAQAAVAHGPKYADARDTLGWVRYRRGEYAQAVAVLKEAKAMAPGSADVAGHLGLAYAKAGNRQEALAELRRALATGSVANRPELERVAAQLSGSAAAGSEGVWVGSAALA